MISSYRVAAVVIMIFIYRKEILLNIYALEENISM